MLSKLIYFTPITNYCLVITSIHELGSKTILADERAKRAR